MQRCFPDSSVGKESACNAGDPGSIPGLGRSTGEGMGYPLQYSWASLVAQRVKNPPGDPEAPSPAGSQVSARRPGFDPWLVRSPEKGKATYSNILAWRIPRSEEPGRLQPLGPQRVGHEWVTNTHTQLEEKFDQSHTVRKAESRSGYRWQLLFMALHNSAEQVLTNLSCLKLFVITGWLLYLKKNNI